MAIVKRLAWAPEDELGGMNSVLNAHDQSSIISKNKNRVRENELEECELCKAD
jgi:hypothetical protein